MPDETPAAAPSADPPRSEGSRLDAELVRRGLVRSRALAVLAIDEGRVQVDGRAVSKAALKVGADAELTVDGEDRYVSRSALKLVGALDAFQVDPTRRHRERGAPQWSHRRRREPPPVCRPTG